MPAGAASVDARQCTSRCVAWRGCFWHYEPVTPGHGHVGCTRLQRAAMTGCLKATSIETPPATLRAGATTSPLVVFLLPHNPDLASYPPDSRSMTDDRSYGSLEQQAHGARCHDLYCWCGGMAAKRLQQLNDGALADLCQRVRVHAVSRAASPEPVRMQSMPGSAPAQQSGTAAQPASSAGVQRTQSDAAAPQRAPVARSHPAGVQAAMAATIARLQESLTGRGLATVAQPQQQRSPFGSPRFQQPAVANPVRTHVGWQGQGARQCSNTQLGRGPMVAMHTVLAIKHCCLPQALQAPLLRKRSHPVWASTLGVYMGREHMVGHRLSVVLARSRAACLCVARQCRDMRSCAHEDDALHIKLDKVMLGRGLQQSSYDALASKSAGKRKALSNGTHSSPQRAIST